MARLFRRLQGRHEVGGPLLVMPGHVPEYGLHFLELKRSDLLVFVESFCEYCVIVYRGIDAF